MYWSKTALQKYLGVKSLIYFHIFSQVLKLLKLKLLYLMTVVMMYTFYLFHMTIVILCGNFATNILLAPLLI